jgi:hypothetical protein
MIDHDASAKLLLANLVPWLGTIISLQNVQVIVAILSGVASIAVSIASILWIRKQARALDEAAKR